MIHRFHKSGAIFYMYYHNYLILIFYLYKLIYFCNTTIFCFYGILFMCPVKFGWTTFT